MWTFPIDLRSMYSVMRTDTAIFMRVAIHNVKEVNRCPGVLSKTNGQPPFQNWGGPQKLIKKWDEFDCQHTMASSIGEKLGKLFSNHTSALFANLNEGQTWTKTKTIQDPRSDSTFLASYLPIVACQMSVWCSWLDSFQHPVFQRNILRIHWFPCQILQVLLNSPLLCP